MYYVLSFGYQLRSTEPIYTHKYVIISKVATSDYSYSGSKENKTPSNEQPGEKYGRKKSNGLIEFLIQRENKSHVFQYFYSIL